MLANGKFVTFFCRASNKAVRVHADVYCVLADQPERRGTLKLASGNSTHHKRFGYLVDYNQCVDVIRACQVCKDGFASEYDFFTNKGYIQSKESSPWRNKPCNRCTGRMYFDDHPLLCYEPEKGYPMSKLNLQTKKLRGKYITRDHLLSCINSVNVAIERQTWTAATCKVYLRTEVFNQKAIDDIVDFAQNHVTYQNALRSARVEHERWAIISKDYQSDPTKYLHYQLPASWFNFDTMTLYPNVPMHLLLLGVAKAVYIKVSKWLKIKLQSISFKEITKGILDQIKLYCLEWCKVLQYPYNSSDKFGGWVAENFLGFVRISNWFYSLLHDLKETREAPNLDTPFTAWRMKEHKYWLEIRGLSTEGSAKVLKLQVREYLAMESPPPILLTTKLDKNHILSMIDSMNEMISMMLSSRTRYNDIDVLEVLIRRFLSAYDLVDSRMIQKALPSWMSQYNFLCLLNIPVVMRKYGCMRNIWEGGVEGEGFLRKYKRELRNGLKPKWEIWTVKKLLHRVVLEKELVAVQKWKSNLKLECRVYQSVMVIDNIVLEKKPISCIYHNDTEIVYIIYRRMNRFLGIAVDIDWDEYNTFIYLLYHNITLSKNVVEITQDIAERSTGCLLLPRISTPDDTFCIIYSDWRRYTKQQQSN